MRLSLRARLLLGMVLVVVVLVGVTWTITATTRSYLVEQVDARLEQINGPDRVPEEVAEHGPGPDTDAGRERVSDVYEGVVRDGTLTAIFEPNYGRGGSGALPDIDPARAVEAAQAQRNFTVGSVGGDGVRYRVDATQARDGDVFVTAVPLGDVDDTMRRLVRTELAAAALIALVLAAVTWWVLRLGIRPIKQMTTAAERIADGDLTHRVPEADAASEAGQLGLALNHMIDRLEQSVNETTASRDRLQRFVADASHELRTPITTIRGYTELYRMGGLRGPGELDEALRRTEQEAVRMARLVDDLLELAKHDQRRPLAVGPVDLAVLARDAGRDARATAPDRLVSVDASEPAVVVGDEDRLRQVVGNIVTNALVHTPPGSPIELVVDRVDGQVRLQVRDHGPGMTAEQAARVTERFYRVDEGRDRRSGGSGLGLSIVDAVTAAHGGELAVASAVGDGTTVTVLLPAGP